MSREAFLAQFPDHSEPARWRIHLFPEVTSTNETILAAAGDGAPDWTVHLARAQSRGRGRGRHTWWSPPGAGLWMSVLLRPRATSDRLGGVALVAGLAVRRALEATGARSIDLYWPNDLYFQGRKLGGLLGEVRQAPPPATGSFVALGIGLNLDLRGVQPPAELKGMVSSVEEAGGSELNAERLAIAVLDHLWPLYHALDRGGAIPLLVGDSLAGIGRGVRVQTPPQPTWSGTAVGIGEEGELLVRDLAGKTHAVRSALVEYET